MTSLQAPSNPAATTSSGRWRSVLLLLATLLCAAYGYRRSRGPQSPLRLFDLYPGMSLSALEKEIKQHRGALDCHAEVNAYTVCAGSIRESPAAILALVNDSTGRVIAVRAMDTTGTGALRVEAARRSAEWTRAAYHAQEISYPDWGDTAASRWETRDGHWSAQMHFRNTGGSGPSIVALHDEWAMATLREMTLNVDTTWKRMAFAAPDDSGPARAAAARAQSEADGVRRGRWQSVRGALKLLALYERSYHDEKGRYTFTLSDLPMTILDSAEVNILSADRLGWTAEATHPRLDGLSCVAYGGQVSAMPKTRTGVEPIGSERPACDPDR